MKSAHQCYTIPAGKSFVNALADWLLAQYGSDAGRLSTALVLLPNRRSCRSLRDAFLERSGGKPLLLPRIQPISDGDEEFTVAHYGAPEGLVKPPIPALSRQLLLTRLVYSFQRKTEQNKGGYNLEQSARLARQLARLLDDVARENITLDRLETLVEGELATHWQETLQFLTILSQQWPAILEHEGVSDIAAHRNQLLLATVEIWKRNPPAHPIIAAGSTGSQPAITALLSTIAHLPDGHVILPALDQDMPCNEWDMLSETHPQYALKQLLAQLDCTRESVALLTDHTIDVPTERIECLRAILLPPQATMKWQTTKPPLEKGLADVKLLHAQTQFEEARMIAIALRTVLETRAKTAALITPDRVLARMVASQMQRFGIAIDDSAGKPLNDTPPASFLRLAVAMTASAAAPAPLLALLRHPLAAAGFKPGECRLHSRDLELALLRGIRLSPGLDALCHQSKGLRKTEVLRMLEHIRTASREFMQLMLGKKSVPLKELLSAHIAFAEQLATTPDSPGQDRLWAGEAGNALAAFLAQLMEHADTLEPIEPAAYGSLLETLLLEQVYRPRHGLHPRLHILGPMEARLQHFDMVILGGLNDGTWPAAPQPDPWMSRPMRQQFGLHTPEYEIGLEAHDFFQFCTAPEVLLTRSQKVDGTPTVASRWLVRLETLVGGHAQEMLANIHVHDYYRSALHMLEQPGDMPALKPPAPKPPVEARPRRISVTAMDRWLRDPYAIYAQYVLKLKKLAPLDEEPDNADFGTVVHSALEQFAKRFPKDLPDNALEELIACGKSAFADYLDRPAVACLWWPRFESIAEWIIEREKERRAGGTFILAECKGIWETQIDAKPFTLTTSIDRIELDRSGGMVIADYKTGYVPEKKDFERGLANQLPLEALIVLNGAITPPLPAAVHSVVAGEYWKLGGSAQHCEVKRFSDHAKDGIGTWLDNTRTSFESLVRRFDDASTPYTAQSIPSLVLAYNDYEHLTRRKEWEEI